MSQRGSGTENVKLMIQNFSMINCNFVAYCIRKVSTDSDLQVLKFSSYDHSSFSMTK